MCVLLVLLLRFAFATLSLLVFIPWRVQVELLMAEVVCGLPALGVVEGSFPRKTGTATQSPRRPHEPKVPNMVWYSMVYYRLV